MLTDYALHDDDEQLQVNNSVLTVLDNIADSNHILQVSHCFVNIKHITLNGDDPNDANAIDIHFNSAINTNEDVYEEGHGYSADVIDALIALNMLHYLLIFPHLMHDYAKYHYAIINDSNDVNLIDDDWND